MIIDELESKLIGRILEGTYPTSSRLPPIRRLSDEFSLSYPTIQKALKALERGGFVRSEHGRGVFVTQQGRSKAIQSMGAKELLYVCLDDGIVAEYELEIYQEFQRLARESGFLDRMLIVPEGAAPPCDLTSVAGAVVTHYCSLARNLQEHGTPVVYCTTIPVESSISSANPDFYGGCYLATRQLHELGHRDIVFVSIAWSGDLSEAGTFACRYKGYRDAMEDLGLAPKEPLGWNRATPEPSRAILASDKRPDALLVANDVMAVEIMDLARGMGVSIPGDISVMGLEDMRCSRASTPQLSTVGYDKKELATEAFELLLGAIEGRISSPIRKTTPMRLILRDSTRQKP